MKIRKLIAATVTASAMLAAPLASAAPANELQPMWDPGNPKHDLNNAQIENAQAVYDDGDVITVSVSGLKPNTQYVAGQCQMEANTLLWFIKLPGCIGDNQTTVESDNSGNLSFDFTVTDQGANVHRNVPVHGGERYLTFWPNAQKKKYPVSDAEVVIVEDHGKGFRGTQVADTQQTFRVNHNTGNDIRLEKMQKADK